MIKKLFPQFVSPDMTSAQQLEWLYEEQSKPLSSYAGMLLGSREAGKEIVQELFTKLFEKEQRFNDYRHAKGMLKIATRNKCHDALRQRNSQETGYKRFMDANTADIVEDLLMQEDGNDGLLEIIELLGGFDQYIQQIPSPYKEAFVGKYLKGQSYPEICEELQIKVTAARNYIYKAKNILRKLLKQSGVKFPFLGIAMITICRITIMTLTHISIPLPIGNLIFLIPITII